MAKDRTVTKDSTCSVCLESFQEPKVLPCCHSFCLKCLEGTLERAKDKNKITCPQCRTQHEVPKNGVKGFLRDYTINIVEPRKKTTANPTCQQCHEKEKAVTYCIMCTYLCEECSKAHKRLKVYQDHKLLKETTPLTRLEVKPKKTYNCSIHPEEPLKLYCKTCRSLACLLCFVGAHNGHDIGSIDSTSRKEAEENIRDLIKVTHSKLSEFKGSLEYIQAVEKNKTQQTASLKDEIKTRFDYLIAQLQNRRTKLLKEVDDTFSMDLKRIWGEKETHKAAITSLQSALSFARRSLNCQEDTELLALCAQVIAQLETLNQTEVISNSTEKVEITAVTFNEGESGQQVTASLMNIGEIRAANFGIIEITAFDVPKVVDHGQELKFKVTTALNKSTKGADASVHRLSNTESD